MGGAEGQAQLHMSQDGVAARRGHPMLPASTEVDPLEPGCSEPKKVVSLEKSEREREGPRTQPVVVGEGIVLLAEQGEESRQIVS